MTKAELQKAYDELLAQYNTLEEVIFPKPKPPTLEERIEQAEKRLNDKVEMLAQDCYNLTGRIPCFKITIIEDEKTKAHQTIKPKSTTKEKFDEFKVRCSYQTDAVDELISYCRSVGNWQSKRQLIDWLICKLKDKR